MRFECPPAQRVHVIGGLTSMTTATTARSSARRSPRPGAACPRRAMLRGARTTSPSATARLLRCRSESAVPSRATSRNSASGRAPEISPTGRSGSRSTRRSRHNARRIPARSLVGRAARGRAILRGCRIADPRLGRTAAGPGSSCRVRTARGWRGRGDQRASTDGLDRRRLSRRRRRRQAGRIGFRLRHVARPSRAGRGVVRGPSRA